MLHTSLTDQAILILTVLRIHYFASCFPLGNKAAFVCLFVCLSCLFVFVWQGRYFPSENDEFVRSVFYLWKNEILT